MNFEIKHTKAKLNKWIQLKVKVADKLIEQEKYVIVESDNRITIIDPKDYIKILESGYCDSPCYLYRVGKWYNTFAELQEYILNNYKNEH